MSFFIVVVVVLLLLLSFFFLFFLLFFSLHCWCFFCCCFFLLIFFFFFLGRGGGEGGCLFVLFSTSLSLTGKVGRSPYLDEGTAAAKRAALPIPINVCSSFVCPDNGVAANVWDF